MEKYWKILVRVLKFLQGTPEYYLMLSMEGTKLIKWWVDGLYDGHGNMRSHIGGVISMGKSLLYPMSHRKKLNTKSSTDTWLVATDTMMP